MDVGTYGVFFLVCRWDLICAEKVSTGMPLTFWFTSVYAFHKSYLSYYLVCHVPFPIQPVPTTSSQIDRLKKEIEERGDTMAKEIHRIGFSMRIEIPGRR